jgi:hypothetical protein
VIGFPKDKSYVVGKGARNPRVLSGYSQQQLQQLAATIFEVVDQRQGGLAHFYDPKIVNTARDLVREHGKEAALVLAREIVEDLGVQMESTR